MGVDIFIYGILLEYEMDSRNGKSRKGNVHNPHLMPTFT